MKSSHAHCARWSALLTQFYVRWVTLASRLACCHDRHHHRPKRKALRLYWRLLHHRNPLLWLTAFIIFTSRLWGRPNFIPSQTIRSIPSAYWRRQVWPIDERRLPLALSVLLHLATRHRPSWVLQAMFTSSQVRSSGLDALSDH